MSQEFDSIVARLRSDRKFAEITVSCEGQNLIAWTNLTVNEVTMAVAEARAMLSGQKSPSRKKTWSPAKLGFEIDVPEDWSLPTGSSDNVICRPDEAVDFAIGPVPTELFPDLMEREFRRYALSKGYTNLKCGRISIGGKEHVWASYRERRGEWSKKYMLFFGGVQYVITTTGASQATFTQREKVWDAMVRTFRLSKRREQDIDKQRAQRLKLAGQTYQKAYQAVAEGRHIEARTLLERCLRDDPDHVLAHKEMAVVLKKMNDMRGALLHRRKVKQLDPLDTVNRFNLADLLAILGEHDAALREVDELLAMEPHNSTFQLLKAALTEDRLTFPQHYHEEARRQPGEKYNLKLIQSTVAQFGHLYSLVLEYYWDTLISEEEAEWLRLRSAAYIACAIYDAATTKGLCCSAFEIPHGRRPAWVVEGDKMPISLTVSDIDVEHQICQMTIGAIAMTTSVALNSRTSWERLEEGFKARFSNISV